MKKIIGVLGLALLAWCAAYVQRHDIPEKVWAGVTCTLPIILQNGTTADATQVMQDLNQLAGCFTNVATVSSVTCGPGLDGGVITATGTCSLAAARRTNPTFQRIIGAGSSVYTTPTNVLWIEIWMIGGGGGGGGGGSGGAAGSNGGDTCWGTSGCATPIFDAGGGTGAANFANGSGGTGGVVSGTSPCIVGLTASDGGSFIGTGTGQPGGAGPYGGHRWGPFGSNSATPAGTGSGGQGGAGSNSGAPGGGAGAYCYALITNPAASYNIVVGAGGSGGAGGTGTNGQAGANGSIYVLEHYN